MRGRWFSCKATLFKPASGNGDRSVFIGLATQTKPNATQIKRRKHAARVSPRNSRNQTEPTIRFERTTCSLREGSDDEANQYVTGGERDLPSPASRPMAWSASERAATRGGPISRVGGRGCVACSRGSAGRPSGAFGWNARLFDARCVNSAPSYYRNSSKSKIVSMVVGDSAMRSEGSVEANLPASPEVAPRRQTRRPEWRSRRVARAPGSQGDGFIPPPIRLGSRKKKAHFLYHRSVWI